MCGEAEYGRCDCCGKDAPLQRQYFHYNINCDCCNGDTHFEIVWYCSKCTPIPKNRITVTIKPIEDLNNVS